MLHRSADSVDVLGVNFKELDQSVAIFVDKRDGRAIEKTTWFQRVHIKVLGDGKEKFPNSRNRLKLWTQEVS